MSYSNVEKLTAVLTHWLRPMGDAVAQRMLGEKLSGISEWAKRVFPLSADYSVTNDLAFLLKPSVDMLMKPAIKNMLEQSGIDDAHVPQWASGLVEAMKEKSAQTGELTVFESLTFSRNDICILSDLLKRNLPCVKVEEYEVI